MKQLFRAKIPVSITAFCLLFVLFFASCSDDVQPTNPPVTTTNAFPLKSGNYYIYDTYRTDTSKVPQDSTRRNDSTAIGAAITIEGKSAFELSNFRGGTIKLTTDYAAKDTNTAWLYTTLLPYSIELPEIARPLMPSGRRWMKIADFAKTSWTVFDTTLTNVQVVIPQLGQPISVDAQITQTGSFLTKEPVTVGDTTFTAHKFTLSMLVIGKTGGIEATRFTLTQDIWFAENIGIVKDVVNPFTVTLGAPFNIKYPVFGSERLLIKYKVN